MSNAILPPPSMRLGRGRRTGVEKMLSALSGAVDCDCRRNSRCPAAGSPRRRRAHARARRRALPVGARRGRCIAAAAALPLPAAAHVDERARAVCAGGAGGIARARPRGAVCTSAPVRPAFWRRRVRGTCSWCVHTAQLAEAQCYVPHVLRPPSSQQQAACVAHTGAAATRHKRSANDAHCNFKTATFNWEFLLIW